MIYDFSEFTKTLWTTGPTQMIYDFSEFTKTLWTTGHTQMIYDFSGFTKTLRLLRIHKDFKDMEIKVLEW
jgi:hypothetical protein